MWTLPEAAQEGAGKERRDLSSRNLTDITALAGVTGLEALYLSGNRISDLWSSSYLTALGYVSGLVWLRLSGNPVADLAIRAPWGGVLKDSPTMRSEPLRNRPTEAPYAGIRRPVGPSPLPAHDPQPVTRRVVEVLLEAQVAFGSLDRGMPEADLDLLERGAALVGELGEGSS